MRTQAATLVSSVLMAAACAPLTPRPTPFYAVDSASAIPATPGTLIRQAPLKGAPVQAHAYRVLYSSTGLDGAPIAVSGIVIVPGGPPPSRGWDAVAWAHPTTGVATGCAPSLRADVFDEIPGLASLLSRGYVVTATDYPGLGTAGVHPYLVGVSEARAVLDLARAARAIPGESIGVRYAVWGHSQGGQAALFTAELSASYAPELTLMGVGAAAPASDLGKLIDDDMNTLAGHVLMSYAIWSWVRIYGISAGEVVRADKMSTIDSVAAHCIVTDREAVLAGRAAVPLDGAFLTFNPDTLPAWRDLFAQNSTGGAVMPAPVFLAQGTADDIVRPAVTLGFAQHLCETGQRVHFVSMADVSHVGAAFAAAPAMVAWMTAMFSGNPAPSDCAALERGNGGR